MAAPARPPDEQRRLKDLRDLRLLDTAAEERFDRLTRLARRLFDVPIALVSLVDENRQWFKSCTGLEALEMSRDISFCGHAILDDEILVIEDATRDARFSDNPLVTGSLGIRFYAGCPLKVADRSRIGTLCVLDKRPRTLGPEDLELFRDLAAMAERELSAVQLAVIDELTGLSNRRGFRALCHQALKNCRRRGWSAALLYFDLDGLKSINDRHGHAEGDHLLEAFAELLRASLRDSDVIGRLGGDEFAVFLSDADHESVATLLKRFDRHVAEANGQSDRPEDLAFSVGAIVIGPDEQLSVDQLLERADRRMYRDKAGRSAGPDPG